jgi:excisionase family DNA binding protein
MGAAMGTEDPPRQGEKVRLLTVRQAAEYLGTTPATLYGRVWRREIPFIKIGRSVRFDAKDLDELIERSKVRPHEFTISPDSLRRQQ